MLTEWGVSGVTPFLLWVAVYLFQGPSGDRVFPQNHPRNCRHRDQLQCGRAGQVVLMHVSCAATSGKGLPDPSLAVESVFLLAVDLKQQGYLGQRAGGARRG